MFDRGITVGNWLNEIAAFTTMCTRTNVAFVVCEVLRKKSRPLKSWKNFEVSAGGNFSFTLKTENTKKA